MSYTKIALDCPKCGHEWNEHLPIMDKLTDVFLAAEKLCSYPYLTGPPVMRTWQQLREAVEAVKNPD